MGKAICLGADNIARKVKKMYVGVEGVARKVKKAYIGVDGVARLTYSGGPGVLSYYGTIEPLSIFRYYSAGASIGDYALVAGGLLDGASKNTTDVIDVYDKSLTKQAPITLSYSAAYIGATEIGNYAVFAGGLTCVNSEKTYSGVINAFDKSLTRTSPGTLSVNRSRLSVTKVNNYALFAGGSSNDYEYSSVVDVLNSSLTRVTAENLSVAREFIASSTANDKAIFGGGRTRSKVSSNTSKETVYDTIDVYDSSLTKINSSNKLTYSITNHASTSIGNYALFCGGYNVSEYLYYKDLSDAFDDSLTKTIAPSLCEQKESASANNLDGYALFVAGFNRTYSSSSDGIDLRYLNTADAYDESLTKTVLDNISSRRYGGPLVVIGSYALLAGGYVSKTDVDVYQVK